MPRSPTIVGLGATPFAKTLGYSPDDLGGWALLNALSDAGLTAKDVDGLVVNRVGGYETFAQSYGIEPAWTVELPPHGRMAGVSLQLAAAAITAGACSTVALVYGNNGRSAGATYGGDGESATYGTSRVLTRPYGMTSPGAFYALMFERYRYLYGATTEELATVAITFRQHASLNPSAVMRTPIALSDYLNSRYIVKPLHLYDYCLINDGGVALIMTTASQARDLPRRPVEILGWAQEGQLLFSDLPPEDFWAGALSRVGSRSYEVAQVSRSDIDGLMVYDNFSPNVLFALDGLGFCERGEAASWIQGGRIALGGDLPTNTSGGHLSESFLQGWGLALEAVRQLRGDCAERQIPDAEVIQFVCPAPIVSSVIFGHAS